MDGQGDGDHNGPNRHHIHIPTEDQPPNGDNNDMEFIFLLHFIINHHMRVFRQNQIGFVNENVVNVDIENHAGHINHVMEENYENEEDLENDFHMIVNQVIEEEEEEEEEHVEEELQEEEVEPQPGPSRNRSQDDIEQDEGTRIRKRSTWWHEFDYTSDSSGDLDNDEEPLLGRSEERSRDGLDSDHTESPKCANELVTDGSDLAEEAEGSTEGEHLSEQEEKKNSLPGFSGTCSLDKPGCQFETEGKKYFHWWHGVEDNSSDSGGDLDLEENSLHGGSEDKPREDLKSENEKGVNDLGLQDDVSLMPNCVHQLAQSIRDTDLAVDIQTSMDKGNCSAHEAEEHPRDGPSTLSSQKNIPPEGGASKESEPLGEGEETENQLPTERWTENNG
ncbi:ABC transporter F family member 4-like [Corythoichthys intestinalis]|uniref:ABC transporter F family member 4-like n=1 Tax=Corythoichthys intestinalis TaxID=161448 RepID=UPI0025A6237D|nr:ABC transporter F family member 4-like [Corythoichthys intestinalis]